LRFWYIGEHDLGLSIAILARLLLDNIKYTSEISDKQVLIADWYVRSDGGDVQYTDVQYTDVHSWTDCNLGLYTCDTRPTLFLLNRDYDANSARSISTSYNLEC
jgi:hypothetical protein